MGKRAYHKILDFRLRELTDRAATLKLRCEHAAGIKKFGTYWELQRLERRKRMLQDRLRKLERDEDGFWQDLKARVQAVTDDLPGGVDRWIERLDANHAARSREARGQPTAAPASSRLASSRLKT
jgi:hypothetical protein